MSEDTRQFILYRSSAGSGKTYNLAREYLTLALKYPDNFKRILGVTFTNKSTNEMKSRIIEHLSQMAQGDTFSDMAKAIKDTLGFDNERLIHQARMVLARIMHNYSFFAVSTIDSFFQRIIGSFTRETGISGGYSIELDQDKVIADIVDGIYLDISNDSELLDWLVRYSETRLEENKNWDVRNDLLIQGKNLLKEDYQKIRDDVMRAFSTDAKKVGFINRLKKKKAIIENTLSGYAETALEIIHNYGLTIDDFAYKSAGVAGYLLKISKKDISDPGMRILEALQDKGKWYANASEKKEIITDAINNGLYDQLTRIVNYYELNKREYHSVLSVLPLFYGFAILMEIENRLSEYRKGNRLILVSDLTIFLRRIIGENDTPFIYEKTGSVLNHFLIDEFQDTSTYQWENFKPLVNNALAQNHLCLAVGDVKQSIYRWRGGDWRIITQKLKEGIGENQMIIKELDTNWRSLPNIVSFNNYVFTHAQDVIIRLLSDKQSITAGTSLAAKLTEANQTLRDAYRDALQKAARLNQGEGEVFVRFCNDDKEKGVSWMDGVQAEIPHILESAQDRGISLAEIAILVREKKDGARLARYLLDYQHTDQAKPGYKYDVISSDSLFLSASNSIQVLINAMRIIHDCRDKASLFNVVYYFLRLKDEEIKDLDGFFPAIAEKELSDPVWLTYLPSEFIGRLSELKTRSLTDLTEEIIRIFTLNIYSGEIAFLLAFQDALIEYLKSRRGDLEDFLLWWMEKGVETAVQASERQEAARILTIHSAKGLQFKIVIIPFCNWSFDHGSNKQIIWCKSEESIFSSAGYLPVKYSGKLAGSYFDEQYYREQIMAYMDNLNLLYVAMTRAEESLYVYAKESTREKDGRTRISVSGDLLYELLSGDFPDSYDHSDRYSIEAIKKGWDPTGKIFTLGSIPAERISEKKSQSEIIDEFISLPWYDRIQIKKDESGFFDRSDDHELKSRINEGLIIHEILSRVIRKEQLDGVLKKSIMEGSIREIDTSHLRNKISRIWTDPIVNDWFSGDWIIKTEVPVLPQTGEFYRLDRVMLKGNKAVVVDYKTGKHTDKDLEQVSNYTKLLRDMGYDHVEGYLLMLETNFLLKVV